MQKEEEDKVFDLGSELQPETPLPLTVTSRVSYGTMFACFLLL